MRRSEPDPADALKALARRLDTMDVQHARTTARLTQLDQLTVDVAALGRGLADLTHQLRLLIPGQNRQEMDDGQNDGLDDEDDAAGGEPERGQRNWLTVTDPGLAEAWLLDGIDFVTTTLPLLASLRVPGCWVLHPIAVTEILALRRQYLTVYELSDPTGVSELLARWLPGAVRRIGAEVTHCADDRAHRTGGRSYLIPHLDPATVARWWVDTRGQTPDAATAFALTLAS